MVLKTKQVDECRWRRNTFSSARKSEKARGRRWKSLFHTGRVAVASVYDWSPGVTGDVPFASRCRPPTPASSLLPPFLLFLSVPTCVLIKSIYTVYKRSGGEIIAPGPRFDRSDEKKSIRCRRAAGQEIKDVHRPTSPTLTLINSRYPLNPPLSLTSIHYLRTGGGRCSYDDYNLRRFRRSPYKDDAVFDLSSISWSTAIRDRCEPILSRRYTKTSIRTLPTFPPAPNAPQTTHFATLTNYIFIQNRLSPPNATITGN